MDKLTDEQIEMGLELEAKATPGQLHAHGGYLSVRRDIALNIEHLDELGQRRATGRSGTWYGPYQAVPFARFEDCELLAFARNHIGPALTELRELRAEVARLKEKPMKLSIEQRNSTRRMFCGRGLKGLDTINGALLALAVIATNATVLFDKYTADKLQHRVEAAERHIQELSEQLQVLQKAVANVKD